MIRYSPGTGGNHPAAPVAAFRPQIDDIIGGFDHIEIVLDHHDGVAVFHQTVQNVEQASDVGGMQAGGGSLAI